MPSRRAPQRAQITQPIRVRLAPEQPVNPVVRRPQPHKAVYPVPDPPGHLPPPHLPRRTTRSTRPILSRRTLLWILGGGAIMMLMSCAALTLGVGLIYANGILPGVRSGGVSLGELSLNEATQKLQTSWQTITVRFGQRAWHYDPATLGITLDAGATASAAFGEGRSNLGAMLPGLLGRVDVPPVVSIDTAVLQAGLQEIASQVSTEPTNAGVKLVNGQVEATAPINGRALNIEATYASLTQSASTVLADGILELVMSPVQPAITDSTPMLEQARRLLSNPLDIRIYDPVTGDSVYWSVMPEQWGNWLSATSDSNSPIGMTLTASDLPVRDYLSAQASSVLDTSRYLKLDEAVANVQRTISEGSSTPYVRVYHQDRQHVVQPGETITSIAWDYGVPYLYIAQANGGVDFVSAGQSISIPSPDNFMPYEVVPDKRIVVSISQQKTWVYENGQLKWEWLASTGIPDSPTWPGIYQIISHEPNAYAGNWDLWMPNFMGVYQPIPGADFTNGFHGFPTRGGWQLLWTNSLGTRVTYGCILLSDTNVRLLYDWAQEGVVVEIQA